MTHIEERYAKAARSSHLECTEHPGDIDTLIAAGMVREGIGVDLLRLRTDYDSISGMPGARRAMSLLRRMAPTRERFFRFAEELAATRGFSFRPAEIESISVRVIDLFLDPACAPCGGTGMVGEFGAVRVGCHACGGSRRRHLLWETEEVERFAALLELRMAEKIDAATRRIKALLRA